MRRTPLAATLSALAALALGPAAPGAHAGWFPAEGIDSGATAFGGLDLAREGTGAVVYVKPDGAVPHVFLSRMRDGVWQPPERVDAGQGGAAGDPVVAVADGGALVVAWRSGDRVLGAFSDGGPLSPPAVLGSGAVGPPDVDMAIQRTAYVVFAQNGDVRAVRLRRGAWEAVPGVLDVDPARSAGAGAGRPQVAVAADGNGVVVWGEDHADGRTRVHGRRLTELRLSAFPQEVSLPELAAGMPGGDADSPDIAIEDDVSFAWVAFRQDFAGTSRTVARRLVGSLFEAPAVLDRGPGARAPRVSMNGDGVGYAVSGSDSGEVATSLLKSDEFAAPERAGAGAAPLVAAAESREAAIAWQAGGGWVGRFAARDEPFGPEVPLGAGGGRAEMAADESGNVALGWLQGSTVVTAVWDDAPSAARLRTNRAYKPIRRPLLRWGAGRDLWGAQTYRVLVDGKEVGRTTAEELRSPKLSEGPHEWQVLSGDRRGQETPSKPRYVRVDTRGPVAKARVRGRTVRVRVTDAGAGPKAARVSWGDGAVSTAVTGGKHRYGRGGTFTVRVRAEDLAGNRATRRLRVRVR